jgi:hypothetical protein
VALLLLVSEQIPQNSIVQFPLFLSALGGKILQILRSKKTNSVRAFVNSVAQVTMPINNPKIL